MPVDESAGAGPAVGSPSPAPPSRRRPWRAIAWGAALAAGIAAIAVGLAMSASYEKRLEALARETAALRAEVDRQQALVALVRDPATEVVALAGLEPSPSARARMLWNAPRGGLLLAARLPVAPQGKAYQLWAIAGTSPPVSAGVFEVDAEGSATVRVLPLAGISRVDAFAVTLEPAGGVPAPSGPMCLAGKS